MQKSERSKVESGQYFGRGVSGRAGQPGHGPALPQRDPDPAAGGADLEVGPGAQAAPVDSEHQPGKLLIFSQVSDCLECH